MINHFYLFFWKTFKQFQRDVEWNRNSVRDKKITYKIGDHKWRQVATTFQSIFQFAVTTVVVTQDTITQSV